MTITARRRAAVRSILAHSTQYDAATMIISRDGGISAKRDADKTCTGPETIRYFVGYIDDMVSAQGVIREGYGGVIKTSEE